MDVERNAVPTVVGLCGSTRDGSVTKIALERALDVAATAGAETTLLDPDELSLPPYDPDAEPSPAADRLTTAVGAADAILLGTPVYHGSYSSTLKTMLDYCGRDELEDTTVGLVAVAGGSFPSRVFDHLRAVAGTLDAWVVPHEVAIPNSYAATSGGTVADDAVADRLDALGRQAVEYAAVPATARGSCSATVTESDD